MFSGFQEILLILLIVLGIFLVPRLMKPPPAAQPALLRPPVAALSRMGRLAIVLSILWPLVWAIIMEPWKRDAVRFLAVGIGPVGIAWSLKWILAGRQNKR